MTNAGYYPTGYTPNQSNITFSSQPEVIVCWEVQPVVLHAQNRVWVRHVNSREQADSVWQKNVQYYKLSKTRLDQWLF